MYKIKTLEMQRERYIRLAEDILSYFRCERCGECCRTLPISLGWDDIERLYKEEGEAFFDKLDDNAIENCLKTPCPYLNGNRCTIYDKRPLVCRVFPFEFAYPFPSIRNCPLGKKISAELAKLEQELRGGEDSEHEEAIRKTIEAYDRFGNFMYEGEGMKCEVTIVSLELLEEFLRRLRNGADVQTRR
ncbi:MAG: YkgJ family cysteine cluster protein [Methanophagales archaeon]|nr:YkgJ family cysteine cluster protein [Methanophagales archaeon]